MLSISHGVSGAVLATVIPIPAVFIPLAITLHYIEDWTPHWDVGTGLSSGKRKRRTAFLLECVDLAALCVILILGWSNMGVASLVYAFIGAFAALLPDFLEAPRNFLGKEPKMLHPLTIFHSSLHQSIPTIWLGLLPQVILLLFCGWFLQTKM